MLLLPALLFLPLLLLLSLSFLLVFVDVLLLSAKPSEEKAWLSVVPGCKTVLLHPASESAESKRRRAVATLKFNFFKETPCLSVELNLLDTHIISFLPK